MKNVTPPGSGDADSRPPGPHNEDAVTEALNQLTAIAAAEDDRRKTTDSKVSAAQAAIGFIVTLAGGSLALAFLQTPVYDLWHGLVILALMVSVLFFVWAACNIVAANDPKPYQGRHADGVLRMLDEGRTKQELQRDAIADLISNVNANTETTNDRLTSYRAAIENIRKAVIAAGFVPFVVLVGYTVNAIGGNCVPPALRITTTAPSTTPSATCVGPTQASSLKPKHAATAVPKAAAKKTSPP
jgi:hypothetical protein